MTTSVVPVAVLPPAPGEDAHPCLALANSTGRLDGTERADLLRTPEAATRWMIERELAAPDAQLQEYCSSRLRDLRSAVRAVLHAVSTGARPRARDITAINAALTKAPALTLLAWNSDDGFHGRQEHPATQAVEHALSVLAADLVKLATGENAELLTQCAAPSCERFLLRTHARRQWCSTRCGDRVRAARAYAKKSSPTD